MKKQNIYQKARASKLVVTSFWVFFGFLFFSGFVVANTVISNAGDSTFSSNIVMDSNSNITANRINDILYVQSGNGSDIQAKIDLCSNDGCKIIIPQGTYQITSLINSSTKPNINFECVSRASIINGSGLPSYTMWIGNHSRVANCYFIGNDTQTAQHLRMESYDIIENNYFYDGGGIVYAKGQEYSTVENNYYYASGSVFRDIHPIFLSHNANHNKIIKNDIVGNFQRGMYILNANYNDIRDNYIYGDITNSIRGIYMNWGVEYNVIENNYIENMNLHAISLEQADSGIYGWNLNNVIKGNTIVNTDSSGILIKGQNNFTKNTIIEGNKLYDVNTGISVDGGANTTDTVITNNYIQGTSYDALSLDGTNSQFYNNQFVDDASVSGDIIIGAELTTGKYFNYDSKQDKILTNLFFNSTNDFKIKDIDGQVATFVNSTISDLLTYDKLSFGAWTHQTLDASDNLTYDSSRIKIFPDGSLDDVKCILGGNEGDELVMRAKYPSGQIRFNENYTGCGLGEAIHFTGQIWNQTTVTTTTPSDEMRCVNYGADSGQTAGWFCEMHWNGISDGKFNDLETQDITPASDNLYSLGSSILRWLKGWFTDIDVSEKVYLNGVDHYIHFNGTCIVAVGTGQTGACL